MKRFRRSAATWFRRWRRRAVLVPRSVGVAAALLAALIVGGLVWLAADLAGPEMVPVVNRPLHPDDLVEAQNLLGLSLEGSVG